MKKAFSILIFSLRLFAFGQDTIPEPEFTARPYYLKDGKLENVERAEATYETKTIAGGYGGASSFYTVFNPASTAHFSKTSIPRFYIKIEGKFDPDDNLVTLSVAEVKKDRRRFKTASIALGGKARDISTTVIKPKLKKIREGLYEIVFENALVSGEYAFMPITDPNATLSSLATKTKLRCFGID